MQFQERDGLMINSVFEYDQMLARRHLKSKFFPDTTLRALQKRLAKLVSNSYLARPTALQWRTLPIPVSSSRFERLATAWLPDYGARSDREVTRAPGNHLFTLR